MARSSAEIELKSNLPTNQAFCHDKGVMFKKFLPFVPVLLLAGCATGQFTRLTPGIQPRTTNNLYSVEVSFNSQQQSLRWDSVQSYVLVNGKVYPMHQVPVVDNRWEGYVPVAAGESSVKYRFKFDYLYNNFGTAPKPDSAVSPIYTLKVVDQ